MALAAMLLVFSAWFVLKWTLASSAVQRAQDTELTTYLSGLAPDDPIIHYASAVLFEKSFGPEDVRRSLVEFETAASLAPENYILWLELGRARERNGDTEAAELALRRALALAPNYSRVQWALGNALLRQDRIEEAFAHIAKAVAADNAFAVPAATTAWQFFDGDVAKIRRAAGNSAAFDGALASLLGREKRFDEALQIWNALPANARNTTLKDAGTALYGTLLEAKKFRYAASVSADLGDGEIRSGAITNPGFESAVKPDGAGIFEWQIAAGMQPQIVLSTGQKHGGNNSLLMVFNSTDGKEFRTVSQTAVVEPGRSYVLELFYRADLKTNASFRWEVIDAADSKRIGVSDPIAAKAEWAPLVVKFNTNTTADGVTIRLLTDGCTAICPINGNLWFDDFSLRAVD